MVERRLLSTTILGVAVLAMLVLSGCASSNKYGAAKIGSIPEGAEIVNLKDQSHLGMTPAKVLFPGEPDTAEFVTIQLRKPGYIDRITSFWVNRKHGSPEAAEANAIDVKVELEKQ
ncbi:hypothetical protein [Desulfofustis limnaeus]|jgi:hypothetical protein|uniref:PEGA domain-containing protein n=1 Tax=Desulfofustis limnaeus TaxID=2740163 RepID=A0ABM7WDU8_9BACT|nr:hypothetical protein [Desulfofustis limnaeus]BDD89120.1 hypothetical protein DPPLL_34850 [Desulfofustis limnaeus]